MEERERCGLHLHLPHSLRTGMNAGAFMTCEPALHDQQSQTPH